MEFIPICLECNHFENGDKCPYYDEIPINIKNRETRCDKYSGDETNYILYTKDSKPQTEVINNVM